MDCCGSTKPKEAKNDSEAGNENNPPEEEREFDLKARGNSQTDKEPTHSGGCCGGGSSGMWLHLILMIIFVLVILYFTRR